MESRNIVELIQIAKDEEFEEAVNLTKKLMDENILTIDITTPENPLGIQFSLDDENLEPVVSKSPLPVDKYKEIFEDEISEMITANISERPKAWLHHTVEHDLEDKLKNSDDKRKAEELLRQRCKVVGERLVDKNLKDTKLLREITKNKILSDIQWEINRKIFDGQKNREIILDPTATLQFFFVDKTKGVILRMSGYGIAPIETADVTTVDLNLNDIDKLIRTLTEIKNKLEGLTKKD